MTHPRQPNGIHLGYLIAICLHVGLVAGCGSSSNDTDSLEAASTLPAPGPGGPSEKEAAGNENAADAISNAVGDAESPIADSSASPNSKDTSEKNLSEDFYTVSKYDLEADPAEQLKATLKRAEREKKTVLLQVGGDWCHWCKRMSQFFASNAKINELLNRGFLVQKVTFAEKNRNEAFLSKYPPINGYPHLFVFDATGKMLHSQNTAWLEAPARDGQGYSEEKFSEFLERWLP
ncbi:MAG: thioredoxin family protein [Aureliella sp.]